MDEHASHYAFSQASPEEERRLGMFQERLDPLTIRRLLAVDVATGWRCLEVGAGAGSIAAWLADRAAPGGHVTATDVQLGLLSRLDRPNLTVLRHDIRTDDFPPESFDLVHVRAVLMHVDRRMEILRRMVSWLAPGGWLVAEEPDFGMWLADQDPIWAAHPRAWHEAFPHGSLAAGRFLLRQVGQLDLLDVHADAELDVVAPGTRLAEFYRSSLELLAAPSVAAGALSADEAARLAARPTEADFLGCGFAFIGVRGRRPGAPPARQG